jgi:hypothetical protein
MSDKRYESLIQDKNLNLNQVSEQPEKKPRCVKHKYNIYINTLFIKYPYEDIKYPYQIGKPVNNAKTKEHPKPAVAQSDNQSNSKQSNPSSLLLIYNQASRFPIPNIVTNTEVKKSYCQVASSMNNSRNKENLQNDNKVTLASDTRREPNKLEFIPREIFSKKEKKKIDQNKNRFKATEDEFDYLYQKPSCVKTKPKKQPKPAVTQNNNQSNSKQSNPSSLLSIDNQAQIASSMNNSRNKENLQNDNKVTLTSDTRREPNKLEFIPREILIRNFNKNQRKAKKQEQQVKSVEKPKSKPRCNQGWKAQLKDLQNAVYKANRSQLLPFFRTNLIFSIYQDLNVPEDEFDYLDYYEPHDKIRANPKAFKKHFRIKDDEYILKKDRQKNNKLMKHSEQSGQVSNRVKLKIKKQSEKAAVQNNNQSKSVEKPKSKQSNLHQFTSKHTQNELELNNIINLFNQ